MNGTLIRQTEACASQLYILTKTNRRESGPQPLIVCCTITICFSSQCQHVSRVRWSIHIVQRETKNKRWVKIVGIGLRERSRKRKLSQWLFHFPFHKAWDWKLFFCLQLPDKLYSFPHLQVSCLIVILSTYRPHPIAAVFSTFLNTKKPLLQCHVIFSSILIAFKWGFLNFDRNWFKSCWTHFQNTAKIVKSPVGHLIGHFVLALMSLPKVACLLFAKSSVCWNPIIYLVLNPQVMEELYKKRSVCGSVWEGQRLPG